MMDERMGFIADYLAGEHTMIELCDWYEISRKTGYKWVARYRSCGAAGLAERSHAPLVHGRVTPVALVEAIIGLRRARPSWGPRKLVAVLASREPGLAWPSASTAGEILKRAGLVTGRRCRKRVARRVGGLTAPLYPNHVWNTDHKGWVRLGDGTRAEPLTITDGFSRYLISVSATGSTASGEAIPLFERAFREFGLPAVIRSDNGVPFAAVGTVGLTALSVLWLKLGIRHERIDPGRPQQNGQHERFHLTLKEAMHPPSADRSAQSARFEAFTRDYNEVRPHEALRQKPPASVYQPSSRAMPDRLAEPNYPAEAAVRRVRTDGSIKWQGDMIYLSEVLVGETVGVAETETGAWQVHFYDRPIAMIDPVKRKMCRVVVPVHGDDNTPARKQP